MTRALTLRGIATPDAVRRFETHRQPMVLRPLPEHGEAPAGWQLVLLATPKPKHKSAATIRRDRERRRDWAQRIEGAAT